MIDYPNILVAFLEEFEPGYEFERWPHHVTILPWFKADKEALSSIEQIASGHLPITVELGKTAMFGARNDILVRLVESDPLQKFHRALLSGRKGLLGLINSSYSGDNFRPHVTLQGQNDPESRTITIKRLALVKHIGPGKLKRVESLYK